MRTTARVKSVISLTIVATCLSVFAHAETPTTNWPQFRGPDGLALADAGSFPDEIGERSILWQTKLDGPGISSPSIWNDRFVVTTSNDDGTIRRVHCYRVDDGKPSWSWQIGFDTHPKHNKNSFATATAACADEGCYVLFGSPTRYTLFALDWNGKDRWQCELGPFTSQHGPGSSPILVNDLVIVTHEQDGPSSVMAIDRTNGEVRWKTPRPTTLTAYSTPMFVPDNSGGQIVISSSNVGLASLAPEDGKLLWEYKCFPARCVGSPVLGENRLMASCGEGGRGKQLVCVDTSRDLSGGKSRLAWELTKTIPYCPTPVAVQGLLYMILDNGVARCVRSTTGEEVWTERLLANVTSSPICLGDRLFIISETGKFAIIATGEKFQVLGRGEIPDTFLSTPAMAGDRMILRGSESVWCLGPN